VTNEERARLYPIILSEYNPEWPQWFQEEKERLLHFIGAETITRITHIGSTAVPGLTAKPTVDILLEISENADIDKLVASLPSDDYICLSKQTIPTFDLALLLKGYTPTGFTEKVYHIHVRRVGDWDEVRFCEYLRSHPEITDAYAALKRELKERFEHDRDGYTNAKGDYINSITERARSI